MRKIELSSRYNDVFTELEFLDDDRGVITTNSSIVRVMTTPDKETVIAVDFDGGPMVSVGSILDKKDNKRVKTIKSVWLVEFE